MPEIDDRRPAPEPVPVVDAVNHKTRLEHKRVRNHRIVLRVGVLLNVEILLHFSLRIGQERPLGAHRRTEFLRCVVVIGGDSGNPGIRHRDLGIKEGQLSMLLVLLGAVVTACQREDQRVIAL